MKVTAIKDFIACNGSVEVECAAGDSVEMDAINAERLQALGLVELAKEKRAEGPRKAEEDD